MLRPQDIVKTAQQPSLYDLLVAIRADRGLTDSERQDLLNKLRDTLGPVPASTSLSTLQAMGLGGTVGVIASRYFSMSPMAQLVSALAGAGLGASMYGKQNQRPEPMPGFRMLG